MAIDSNVVVEMKWKKRKKDENPFIVWLTTIDSNVVVKVQDGGENTLRRTKRDIYLRIVLEDKMITLYVDGNRR